MDINVPTVMRKLQLPGNLFLQKKKKTHEFIHLALCRSVKFSTFPEILVVNPRRFAFIDWVPQKLNIPIVFPEGNIQLDKYVSLGQQPGEELLPEESTPSSEPAFNQNDIDQLKAMGFSENRCKRALLNTGHNGADIAMNWMFEHMDDPGKWLLFPFWKEGLTSFLDIDDPLPTEGANASGATEEQISTLQEMGFTAAQAKKALRETVSLYF